MKELLLGYGKMGQVIEERTAGKEVKRLFEKDKNLRLSLSTADVAIDFKRAYSSYRNISIVFLLLMSCNFRDKRFGRNSVGW
jgi:hypothetical protein